MLNPNFISFIICSRRLIWSVLGHIIYYSLSPSPYLLICKLLPPVKCFENSWKPLPLPPFILNNTFDAYDDHEIFNLSSIQINLITRGTTSQGLGSFFFMSRLAIWSSDCHIWDLSPVPRVPPRVKA